MLNAAQAGCVGVVLFPDPMDFSDLGPSDRLIANAKLIDGDPLTPGIASVDGGKSVLPVTYCMICSLNILMAPFICGNLYY